MTSVQPPAATHVSLAGVTKRFGETVAVRQLELDIEQGSFTTLLGPSGCGKTTTLRMIAGFFDPDEGDIRIHGVRQNGLPPFKRNVSIVFQEYALFPHMSVYDNVAYGLRIRRERPAVVREKVERTLALLGLSGLEGRAPHALSGGQQQRVALARSLVMEPEVLLMDEPLSNLDAKLRIRLRAELRQLQKRVGITTIYVTHDQEEALALSDRVAVLKDGVLRQYSTPWELYYEPSDPFVADFVGLANFLPAAVQEATPGAVILRIGGGLLRLPRERLARLPALAPGQEVTVMVRPEWVRISPGGATEAADPPGARHLAATVASASEETAAAGLAPEGAAAPLRLPGHLEATSFMGSVVRYWLRVPGLDVPVVADDHTPVGRTVWRGEVTVELDPASAFVLPGPGDQLRQAS